MSRKTLLLPLLVAVVLVLSASASAPPTVAEVRGERGPRVEASTAAAAAGPPAVHVVEVWDSRRAQAWARGDLALLRRLYTPHSIAGRHDRAMLRAWLARGLVVRDLHTQLLAVEVLGHTPSTWTLRVTDRMVGGVAVGRDVRLPLPRDQPTTRALRLRLVHGRWLMAEVMS